MRIIIKSFVFIQLALVNRVLKSRYIRRGYHRAKNLYIRFESPRVLFKVKFLRLGFQEYTYHCISYSVSRYRWSTIPGITFPVSSFTNSPKYIYIYIYIPTIRKGNSINSLTNFTKQPTIQQRPPITINETIFPIEYFFEKLYSIQKVWLLQKFPSSP